MEAGEWAGYVRGSASVHAMNGCERHFPSPEAAQQLGGHALSTRRYHER